MGESQNFSIVEKYFNIDQISSYTCNAIQEPIDRQWAKTLSCVSPFRILSEDGSLARLTRTFPDRCFEIRENATRVKERR